MIKITAIIFTALGFAFMGHYLSSVYERKVEILSSIVMMILVMQTQFRYACITVTSLLGILEENRKTSTLGFISSCREKTERGESFPLSWRTCVEHEKELCRLIPEALPYLIQLGEDLGSTDLEGQLSCCEYYKQIFEKELEEKEEQCKKYSKVFPTLGVMLGVSAAILII